VLQRRASAWNRSGLAGLFLAVMRPASRRRESSWETELGARSSSAAASLTRSIRLHQEQARELNAHSSGKWFPRALGKGRGGSDTRIDEDARRFDVEVST
jgi:hypothetical protein